jgi:ornithine decarboxylase
MIRPFYAVKCNPDRLLLSQLSQLGAGFDCASGREMMEVAELGGNETFQTSVVYANPCKPLRDLQKAKLLGSPTTVIDSFEEVDKLVSVGWTGGAFARLLVEDKNSIMPFSRKFGFAPEKVTDLSIYAKNKGIALKGVSFHVGSGCEDPNQYKAAINLAMSSLKTMKAHEHPATTIDIGGGFMADQALFEQYARVIRCGMAQSSFGLAKELRPQFIAEPGRFFATNSFDLFVQVIGKKPSLTGDGWRYTIDESLYGQFSCIPFDHKKPTWLRVPIGYHKEPPRKKVKGTLFGRTCDSLDMIAQAAEMEELEVGDWLWFPNMGAYTSVTASEFNGFPRPPYHSDELSLYLPTVEKLKPDHCFPKGIKTVTPVSIVE